MTWYDNVYNVLVQTSGADQTRVTGITLTDSSVTHLNIYYPQGQDLVMHNSYNNPSSDFTYVYFKKIEIFVPVSATKGVTINGTITNNVDAIPDYSYSDAQTFTSPGGTFTIDNTNLLNHPGFFSLTVQGFDYTTSEFSISTKVSVE
jgi:hypothetical protein